MASKKHTPIFEALNNSLLFALALVGLAIYVYQNDQRQQDGRLDSTAVLIDTLQQKQSAQNDILLRMQEAQIQIAKQIERNTDKINAVNLTRFTDQDGVNLRASISDKLDSERFQRQQQYDESRESMKTLKTELQVIQDSLSELRHDCP